MEDPEQRFLYKCNMCENMGLRQLCKEHKEIHGHGMVHLDKVYKRTKDFVSKAWWLCNKCAEREQ